MIISQASGARVDAFAEAVSSQTTVRIATTYESAFRDLVIALEQVTEVADIAILTDTDTIRRLRESFLTTSRLVDYIQEENIEIRAVDSSLSSLVITEDTVKTTIGFPDANQSVVETTGESLVGETSLTFDERFSNAEEITLRKPGYSALFESLEEQFDESLADDFTEALKAAKASEGPALEIDPVHLSLLVGGYHEISFYKLARWGEDASMASRAKFSRMKQELEEGGIIEHEPIPREVGRLDTGWYWESLSKGWVLKTLLLLRFRPSERTLDIKSDELGGMDFGLDYC